MSINQRIVFRAMHSLLSHKIRYSSHDLWLKLLYPILKFEVISEITIIDWTFLFLTYGWIMT